MYLVMKLDTLFQPDVAHHHTNIYGNTILRQTKDIMTHHYQESQLLHKNIFAQTVKTSHQDVHQDSVLTILSVRDVHTELSKYNQINVNI